MCFPETHSAKEDHVHLLLDELEAKEILDSGTVDYSGPAPSELLQGLCDGESGKADFALDGTIMA